MDERIREHAEVLVDWSARVSEGDHVVLSVGPDAHELAVAVAEALGERGATVCSLFDSGEITRAHLTASEAEIRTPEHERALYEEADVYLSLGGGRNPSAMADVPGDRLQARDRARQPVSAARRETDWVKTLYPTRSLAQRAGMAFEAYQDFLYRAVLRDWEALADEMARLKAIFDDGDKVRLVNEGSDLTMRIDDRIAVNSAASVDYDSHNLPSGEVFTAPFATEGHVIFDVPQLVRGRRVQDVRLTFADGEVADIAAAQGASVIEDVVETDEGARRLGELGVGMNRGIDRPTDTLLFDEKMGGTVHLALGRAYASNFPDGEADRANDSAVHVDLITRMGPGSRLLVDGEIVQADGLFRWEDGFDETAG